jgi:hypothetical protein
MTTTTDHKPGIIAGMAAAIGRDLVFFATGESTVPAPAPAPVPPSMTAQQYLAERDRLNAWADHYRATGDTYGLRLCWQARQRLNDTYRALRPGAVARRAY